MGPERDDNDPTLTRGGTEPGRQEPSGPMRAAAPSGPVETADEAPPPVDFDALRAALGDPLGYDDLPTNPGVDGPALAAGPAPAFDPAPESSGRSSASYASARPHTIPPTRAPMEDPNTPAVILAEDLEEVTIEKTAPVISQRAIDTVRPASGRHLSAPLHVTPSPHAALGAGYPHGPQAPHAPQPPQRPQPFANPPQNATIRMPAVVPNPRRARMDTVTLRPHGPSPKQKLLAFIAVLLVVMLVGGAVILLRMQ